MGAFIFGMDRKYSPVGQQAAPQQPTNIPMSSGMVQSSSSSQPYGLELLQNPVDTSVPPSGQVNLKSSSTAQPVAKKPAPVQRKPAPSVSAGQEQKTPAPSGENFTFTKVAQPVAEAPVDEAALMKERAELGNLAEGTAQSIINGPSQKYQSVYGWLRRNDPTLTPWTDFVLHGPRISIAKSNQSDMEAARLEQQMIGRQMGNGNLTMPQVRLRQQMQAQWDKLLGRWEAGRFAGDEQTEQQFYDEANRLLTAMQNAGMDTSTLSMPSMNPGGFSQGYNKNLAEPLDKLRHLDSVMGEIYTRAANDPMWVTGPEATNLFDKLGELTIVDLAMSKGQIADAEKVRQQVAMMDPTIRKMYDNIMCKFFLDNQSLQRLAMEYSNDLSVRKTIEDFGRDINGQNLGINEKPAGANIGFGENVKSWFEKGSKKHKSLMGAIGTVVTAVKNAGGDVPDNLMAAYEAMQGGIEKFQQYVLQDAPVNMALIWELGERMRNENLSKYNDWTRKNGKMFGWKYRSAFNMPENFGDELRAFQQTKRWRDAQAPVYNMNLTASPHFPKNPGEVLPTKGKRYKGGGSI